MIAATLKTNSSPPYHLSQEEILSEMEVIRAAQEDIRKFEPLYKSYYPRIVAFVYQRVNDKETAYEVTAEVFYKAVNGLKKYRPQGVPFGAWLFRIALNQMNELFRKNKVQRTINIDSEGLGHLTAEMHSSNHESCTDQDLFEALQWLEPEELELIDMRFFENRSFKEICGITGLAESACKMRIYRILDKLKIKIKNIVS